MQDARAGSRSYAVKGRDAQVKTSRTRATSAASGRCKTLADAFRRHGAKLCDGSRLNAVGKGLNVIGSVPPTLAVSVSALYLSQNNLHGLSGVEQFQSVRLLSVGGNLISRFEELDRLAGLRHLRNLNLVGNPICELPNYRLRVIDQLSAVQVLDASDVTKKEREIAAVVTTQDRAMRATLVDNHYAIYKLQRATLLIQLHHDLLVLILNGVQYGRFDRVPGPQDAEFDIDQYLSLCDVKEMFSTQAQAALEQQMLAIVVRTYRKLSEHPKIRAKEYLVGLAGANIAIPPDLHQLCIAWDEAYNSVISLQQQSIITLKGVCECKTRDAVNMIKEWLIAQPEKRKALLLGVSRGDKSMVIQEKPRASCTAPQARRSRHAVDANSSLRLPPQQKDPDALQPQSSSTRILVIPTTRNSLPAQEIERQEFIEKDRQLPRKGAPSLRSGEFANRTLGEAIHNFSLRSDTGSKLAGSKPTVPSEMSSKLMGIKPYSTSSKIPASNGAEIAHPSSSKYPSHLIKEDKSCSDHNFSENEPQTLITKTNAFDPSPRKAPVGKLHTSSKSGSHMSSDPLVMFPVDVNYHQIPRTNRQEYFRRRVDEEDAISIGATSDNTSTFWIPGDVSDVSARIEGRLEDKSPDPPRFGSHSTPTRNISHFDDQSELEEKEDETPQRQPHISKSIQPSSKRLQELEDREEKYIKALMESEQRELELRNNVCSIQKQLAYYQHAFLQDMKERQHIKQEVEKRVLTVAQPKMLRRYFSRWVRFYSWTLQFNHVRRKRAFVVQYDMFWQWRKRIWLRRQVLELARKRQMRELWIVFGEWANAARLSIIASQYREQQNQRLQQHSFFLWKDSIKVLKFVRDQVEKFEAAHAYALVLKCWKEWKRMARYRQQLVTLDRIRCRENSRALQQITMWKWKIYILSVVRPVRSRIEKFCESRDKNISKNHLGAWKRVHYAAKMQRLYIIRRSWKRWASNYLERKRNRRDEQKEKRIFLKSHFQAWQATANDMLTSRRALALAKRYVNQRRMRKLWLHWKFFAITRKKYRQGSTKGLKHYFVRLLRCTWTQWKTKTTQNLQNVKCTKYRTLRFHFESFRLGIQSAKREQFQTRMVFHKRFCFRLKLVRSCLAAWRQHTIRRKWLVHCSRILQHYKQQSSLGLAWRVWRSGRIKCLVEEGTQLQQRHDKLMEDKNELEADLMVADDKILSIQEQNTALSKQFNDAVDRIEELEKMANSTNEEYTQNRSKLIKTIGELEQRCRELQSQCVLDVTTRDRTATQIQMLEKDKEQLADRVAELERIIASEHLAAQDAQTAIDDIRNKMLQEQLTMQTKLDTEVASRKELEQAQNALQLQLAQEQKEREETANRLQEYEQRIATTCQAINQHENEHEHDKMQLRFEYAQLEARWREENARNSELQRLLSEKNEQIRSLESTYQTHLKSQAQTSSNPDSFPVDQATTALITPLYPIQTPQQSNIQTSEQSPRTNMFPIDMLVGEITNSPLLQQRKSTEIPLRSIQTHEANRNRHLHEKKDYNPLLDSHSRASSKLKKGRKSGELTAVEQERLIDERTLKVHDDIRILQQRISKRLEEGALKISNMVEHRRPFSTEPAKLLLSSSITSLSDDSSSAVDSLDFSTCKNANAHRTKTKTRSAAEQGMRLPSTTRKLVRTRHGRENIGDLSNTSSAPRRAIGLTKKAPSTNRDSQGRVHGSASTLIAAARKKKASNSRK